MATSARQGEPIQRFAFTPQDSLLFGPESSGLPEQIQCSADAHACIPIKSCVRSLNLSTAVGIVLYAALTGLGMLDGLNKGA